MLDPLAALLSWDAQAEDPKPGEDPTKWMFFPLLSPAKKLELLAKAWKLVGQGLTGKARK